MLINLFRRNFVRQVKRNNLLSKLSNDIFVDEFQDTQTPKIQLDTDQDQNKSKDNIQLNENEKQLEIIEEESYQNSQESLKFIRETLLYQGEDQFPDQLVNRPEKQVVWGLGGELLRIKQQVFQKNKLPEVEEVIAFLELEQCKEISVVDMKEIGRPDLPNHSIIATTYSERHNFRVASNLVKAVQQLNIKKQKIKPSLHGRKDDDWILVCLQEIDIHLFLQEARDEMNLEHKWKNPISEEECMIREREIEAIKKGNYKPLDL